MDTRRMRSRVPEAGWLTFFSIFLALWLDVAERVLSFAAVGEDRRAMELLTAANSVDGRRLPETGSEPR
jgi:hypothetical protein